MDKHEPTFAAVVLVVLTLPILLGLSACSRSGPETALYQSVKANEMWSGRGEMLAKYYPVGSNVSEYVVEKGKLYLLVQKTHTDYYFVDVVHINKWDKRKATDLIRRVPKLRRLMPHPEMDDGGIAWLSVS